MKMTAKATADSVRLEMISEMDIQKLSQISEQEKTAAFYTTRQPHHPSSAKVYKNREY